MISEELNDLFVQTKYYARAIDRCGQLAEWATLYDWWRRIRGATTDLIAFEDVVRSIHSYQKVSRGLHTVSLCDIVGSVGRRQDFTYNFLPRRSVSPQRWARIDRAFAAGEGLPAVDLYQIGALYFVMDGHHRVSVARDRGFKVIEANVTEIIMPLQMGTIRPTSETNYSTAERLAFLVHP